TRGTTLQIDLEEAGRFLEQLDQDAAGWTFQTFDDNSDRKDKRLVRTLHGTLADHAETLIHLQEQGAGVFVTVNRTDLKGRKTANIQEVRAAFVDLDGAPVEPVRAWEEPHILVETSPGKWHGYWLIDGLPLAEFSDVQKVLIEAFGADRSVNDLPRVMRLPGFWHLKSEPFKTRLIDTSAFPAPFTPAEFKDKLEAIRPKPEPKPTGGFQFDTGSFTGPDEGPTLAEVADALTYIDADALDYREWLGVLMGIHHQFGPGGEGIAEEWSSRGAKHKPRDVSDRFKGFTPGGKTTIKAVFHLAARNGCNLSDLAKKHRSRKSTPRGTPKRTPGGNPQHPDLIEVTEDAVALNFTTRHGDRMRFDHDAGRWFEWNGDHWKADGTQRAFQYCREQARKATVDAQSKEIATARRAAFAAGVERFARADPAHAVTQEVWDQDPFLLGCPEATVDLRTGSIRSPDPADMITRRAAVAPADQAVCPRWLSFLQEATGGDGALIRFLQQWAGYSLTGDTREHALMFIYGDGGNGKSVFLNTVAGILGDYSTTAGMDTFTASQHERHPTDLAMLKGARLVSASETEEGRAWAESRIKQMTGGDKITARFMRKDFFTYTPQFKLMVIGNHKPVLQNIDDAIRRRFNIVPFTRRPATPDKELETKLQAEWPGILRWMIEGCSDWRQNGLIRPQSVTEATAAYFDDQDVFAQFLADKCRVEPHNPHLWEPAAALFKAWSDYAHAGGEKPGTKKAMGENLAKRGFQSTVKRVQGGTAKVWAGLELIMPSGISPE
ncbi:MAG: phage/plasmid primase, P4 family, partial [Paracoccus sp. (in: a-proteobacteria)]|nr:phage/plasmid primase, P4 family [Paracoccus sp. (in: a-proteobacteria)]